MNIVVDGSNAFVATGGCAFDPKKPTVVFIHGSGLDHRSWALQSRWFAFHGSRYLHLTFQVIVFQRVNQSNLLKAWESGL
jgi:pimeloyl-ACP methyl ester carboxylesterase